MPLHVNEILQKEMDRKNFIKYVGATLFFVVGGGMLVKAAHTASSLSSEPKSPLADRSANKSAGYGSSAYGGSKSSQSS